MRKCLSIMISIMMLSIFVFQGYSDQDRYPADQAQNTADQDRYPADQDRNTSDQDQYQAQYYDNAKVLRVKYSEGETYVQRSYEEGFEEASMNLSIFEKDKVGTTEGRVEVYLGRLNYLRLDYDSEVEFERAPELRKTDMAIRVTRGGIYLDIQNLDNERDIEIQTPDCGIFLLSKGLYRINVNERGKTNVLVHEGLAEVSGNDYSRYVRENQKIVMVDGRVAENPYYFYASRTDEFDLWNKERISARGYARYGTSRYLAHGYEDYEYELSRYGRWVYYNDYREYIWIPYHIGSSWSPYYNGRWTWNPHYGYVWNSYDHWGYFTHHYGRWHWDNHYGWYWYPGYHWSPAWVYWFWDNDYYGWCPLSRWNRPVIIVNNQWNRHHNYHREGIPVHSRSTVIIKKNHLNSSHINRIAINKTVLKNASIKAKGFSPKEKYSTETINVINARGKAVAYKKGGFLESHKYEILKPGAASAKTGREVEFKYKESAGKNTEKRAFKYSKVSKVEIPSPEGPGTGTQGREIKIEKKETVITPGGIPSRKVFKSDNSAQYKEKSGTAGKESEAPEKTIPEKNVPREVPKIKYKPVEPQERERKENQGERKETQERKKSESSGTSKGTAAKSSSSSSSSSSSTSAPKKIKVKEKEKNYPSFSSSERNYPSSKPSYSEGNAGSYRSTYSSRSPRSTNAARSASRYYSYRNPGETKKNDNTGYEKYVPSYRSNSYSSLNNSYRSESSSSRPYSSNSSNRYTSSGHSNSYHNNSSSSYSSSSSHSFSAPSSSSHSSYSASASSGSHHGTAVKKRD